jgi:protein involved in polysaccharide export with SLBB domain
MRSILLFVCSFMLALRPALVEAQTAPPTASQAPVLSVGDAVRITVRGEDASLSGEFDIAEDGTVIHPLYRAVRAVGLSQQQLEAEVRRVLQRFTNSPEFVVEQLYRISVAGEVRAPNVYTAPSQTTITQAISLAGGPTPEGRVERVRLLRNGSEIPVDLTRPYAELASLRVRSGDQIIVDPDVSLWRDRIQPVLTSVGAVASIVVVFLRIANY